MLLSFILCFWTVYGQSVLFNGTYRSPQVLLENECGAVQIRNQGPVHIYMTFFDYCDMTQAEQANVNNYMTSFRILGQKLIEKAATTFSWDVTLFFRLPNEDACSFPAPYNESLTLNNTQSVDSGMPTVIQVNMLLPLAEEQDVNIVTGNKVKEIKKELVHSRAAGMVTISILGPYSSYVKTALDKKYDDTLYPFFEFATIADSVKLNVMHLLSVVGCNPSYLGAVPYSWYDQALGKTQCECECPQGQSFHSESDTVKVCKPNADEDTSGQCNWLAKCYVLTLQQSTTHSYDGECKLQGYFAGGIAKIPSPWDNYVSGKVNIFEKGAKIVVALTDPEGSLVTKDYEWIDFQKQGNEIMDRDFPFRSVGIHNLQVEAHDYHRDSVCTTEIKILDDLLPTVPSTASCPRQVRKFKKTPTYGNGLTKVLDVLQQFSDYTGSRMNDPCGNGASCDKNLAYLRNIDSYKCNPTSSPPSWVLNADDKKYLYRIDERLLHDIPGSSRKKCWHLVNTFGEMVTSYSCHDEEKTVCEYGSVKCSLYQCIKAIGSDFFTATFEIEQTVRQRSSDLNVAIGAVNFNAYTEIHESIAETIVGTDPGEGTYSTFLSNMILVDFGYTDLAMDSRVAANEHGDEKSILDIVKCRYRINNGVWKPWLIGSDQNEAEFSQEDNEITIEAWTTLGRIGLFDVRAVIHPHSTLDVCATFEQDCFYQTISATREGTEHGYCSFPKSDFAEITFDFSHKVGLEPLNGVALPYHFQNITCMVYYLTEDSQSGITTRISHGAPILHSTNTNLRFIERYGIDLKSGPTDVNTPIEFDCQLWYKSSTNNSVRQHCKQTLIFDDCEAPEFPSESQGNAFSQCTRNCKPEKIQPYGYCGNNHLQFVPNEDIIDGLGHAAFTSINHQENQCCTECGNYQCLDLVHAGGNVTLKSCRIESPDIVLLQSKISYSSSIQLLCLTLTCVAAILYKHNRAPAYKNALHLPLFLQNNFPPHIRFVQLANGKKMQYPKVRRDESHYNTYESKNDQVKVSDPYHYLEDPDSEETKSFVVAQNDLTQTTLKQHVKGLKDIEDKMTELYNYEKYSCPMQRCDSDKGYRFYYKNNGLQNQYVLYLEQPDGVEDVVVLDPNELSSDGTVSLGAVSLSSGKKNGVDHLYLAYGLSKGGSDWQTVKVLQLNLEEQEKVVELKDTVDWVKFSSLAWMGDDSGFFYSRFPDSAVEDKGTETNAYENHQLWFHPLGNDGQEKDVLVFALPDTPKYLLRAVVSDDGEYLIVYVQEGCKNANKVYVCHMNAFHTWLNSGDERGLLDVVRLVDNMDAAYSYLLNDGSQFMFQTNLNAARERIVSCDVNETATFTEIIPEPKDQIVQESSWAVGDGYILVQYLEHVKNVLTLYDLKGNTIKSLDLPGIGTTIVAAHRFQPTFFFKFTSFLYPGTIYKADIDSMNYNLYMETKIEGFDPSVFETKQLFYPSKDGTKIPMYIVGKKGLPQDGNQPTYLYGYGGFNIAIKPAFSIFRVLFIQKFNGMLAFPNLRGGSEYGEAWHSMGTKKNKQNVFDDMHAAATHLIQENYTNPSKIAIHGGSNGGLLVAACANQRPDLYQCGVASVGVLDMLRFHKFTIGAAWQTDYGNPDEASCFDYIYKYSPLHNIPTEGQYPAMLLTTGDHDDRVVPLHSYKFIAQLQHSLGAQVSSNADTTSLKPYLIRIETDAGHGSGKPTSKVIAEYAQIYGFIAWQLNITL